MTLPFPTDVKEFDSDDRISYSKLDNKFLGVLDDGSEFEYDANLQRWVPAEIDPVDDNDGDNFDSKKRKTPSQTDTESEVSKTARPNKKQKAPAQPKQNTAVYVTGLPLDATVDEVHELFSRKAGVIAEEIDSGAPRIKLYSDAEGTFKGDALIVFFKPQSVEMAMMLLDDTDFRFTTSGTREGRISVQPADSSYKKVQYDQEGGNGDKNNNGTGGRRQQPKSASDRHKVIKKTQKLDAKLADWDDDEPTHIDAPKKSDKVVILEHMFTLQELEEDPAALLEIKEDVREECAKLGAVTNVVLYDEEPDGIVVVKFKEAEAAEACIKLMHGRSFDGRVVQAWLSSGKEKFNKSSKEEQHDTDEEN